jgi:hypothetical protein
VGHPNSSLRAYVWATRPRAARGRFVDSSTEGIVLEADCAARAGQRNTGQSVLEVPSVAGGVRPHNLGERVAVVVVRIARAWRRGQLIGHADAIW